MNIIAIKSAFEDSWVAALKAYWNHEVNSECTLQSAMYAELRSRVPGDYVVLCEPQMTVERHGCFVPDIVVVHERLIVGIAEIKFVPHGYPVYELDLRKLTVLSEAAQTFRVLLDPSTGNLSSDSFKVDAGCLLVFAAIGKRDAVAVDALHLKNDMKKFGDRFIPLVEKVSA